MEIVLRAVIIFLFLWVVTRLVGRTTLGELSSFQLIVFITMGDFVQQGVTQQDYSMTGRDWRWEPSPSSPSCSPGSTPGGARPAG